MHSYGHLQNHHSIHANHYNDVTMGEMTSQITSLKIICSTIYWSADQRIHQSSVSLAFVRGINRWPVNSPHQWPVTRKCFNLMTSSCAAAAAISRYVRWVAWFSITKYTGDYSNHTANQSQLMLPMLLFLCWWIRYGIYKMHMVSLKEAE